MKQQILGIDLGNYNVKVSNGVVFPSLYTEIDENEFLKNKVMGRQHPVVMYEGRYFLIGVGEPDTELRKSIKKVNPLLLYALHLSATEKTVKVVTGIPLSQFRAEDKKAQEKKLKGEWDFEVWTKEVGKFCKKTIVVEDVICLMECFGAIFANGVTDREYILIDMGGLTTNIIKVKDGVNDGNGITVNIGAFALIEEIQTRVMEDYNFDITLDMAKEVLENGGQIYDALNDRYIQLPIDRYKMKIVEKIKNDTGRKMPYANFKVYLSGGGSEEFKDQFAEVFPNSRIVPDYLFSNAKGYQRIGVSVWHK